MDKRFSAVFMLAAAAGLLVLVLYKGCGHRDFIKPFYGKTIESITVMLPESQDAALRFFRKGPGRWLVNGWPAGGIATGSLIDGIKALRLEYVISEDPEKFPMFGVDKQKGSMVELIFKGGDKEAFFIGKRSAETAKYYFRYADGNKVYIEKGPGRRLLGKPIAEYRASSLDEIAGWNYDRAVINGREYSLEGSSQTWKNVKNIIGSVKATGFFEKEDRPGLKAGKKLEIELYSGENLTGRFRAGIYRGAGFFEDIDTGNMYAMDKGIQEKLLDMIRMRKDESGG